MTLRRITVIDDSPEILAVFGDALRREGVEVTLLDDRVTIQQIEMSEPELLVVDLRLGTDHLPGWEIIRHIRAHPMLADVPVIVCSGALDQMRDYGGPGAGMPRTYLLPKPFSLPDLEAVLDEAIMAASQRTSSPVEPGSPADFGRDPYAWFSSIGIAVLQPDWAKLLGQIEPSTWRGREEHAWRVVRTTRGIEVRPELTSPFLRYGDQPMVSALGIGEEIVVELTTRLNRWVDRFARDAFDLAGLGHAMLDERKLSHDNLSLLFPPRAREQAAAFHVAEGQPLHN